jgi:hypothetical protein
MQADVVVVGQDLPQDIPQKRPASEMEQEARRLRLRYSRAMCRG